MPPITIFCAFTRRWAVEKWIDNLKSIEHDPSMTNLCFIVDIDEPFIVNRLKRLNEEGKYRSFHIQMNSEHNPNEVRINTRRMRIAEVKNQSKHLIAKTDGVYVIGLEDDSVFDHLKCFCRLLEPLHAERDVAFVEGVQCGRWGVKMIGAWNVAPTDNPIEATTLLPKEAGGYEEISAGGFYFYSTRRELYLNHEYYSSTAQPWGPDVNYGLWLKRLGYRCLIDWDTKVGHNDHNSIYWPEYGLSKIIFEKDTNTGLWSRMDIQRSS